MGSDNNLDSKKKNWSFSITLLLIIILNGFLIVVLLLYVSQQGTMLLFPLTTTGLTSSSSSSSSSDCMISIGKNHHHYRGPQYTSIATIGTPKCLIESKFLKVQQHVVQLLDNHQSNNNNNNNNKNNVIDDWIWIDYHDRINVLIEAPINTTTTTTQNQEPHFIILEQTKYALEGRTSLAIVGGIIEPGEQPKQAAIREVQEETGHICKQFDFLGRYRTDVNRGMGWTNTYVARNCNNIVSSSSRSIPNNPSTTITNEVGTADAEHQTLLTMSLTEVRNAVLDGRFLEIQWSATVALALLFYEKRLQEQQQLEEEE